MNKICFSVIAAVILILPVRADAVIVDLSGDRFQDQNTGYIWKDVGLFYNQTYSDIQSLLFGSGFHIAKDAELLQLHSTLPLATSDWLTYESIMGAQSPRREIIWGWYDDTRLAGNDISWAYGTGPLMNFTPSTNWQYLRNVGNSSFDDLGAWVVCDNDQEACLRTGEEALPGPVVPEPATIILFGLGFAGLIGGKGNNKRP